jgi:hypothetical protein
VGLDLPVGGAGLAYPYGDGVVVVVLHLGVVVGAAVEGVDYVVGGEGGVGGEDADLEVAEFVGVELAVLEGDQQRVYRLDLLVDLDEVFGEEAADCREVAFGHGGPQVLFEIYDFDGGWGLGGGLCGGRCDQGDQDCEEEAHGNYVSASLAGGTPSPLNLSKVIIFQYFTGSRCL